MRHRTPQLAPTPTALNIGRLVDANLGNWLRGTIQEIAHTERSGQDASDLLTLGWSLVRAQNEIRAAVHDIRLEELAARR